MPQRRLVGLSLRELLVSAEDSPPCSNLKIDREERFSYAYEAVAHLDNALRITAPIAEPVTFFHDRPFRVIHGGRFASVIIEAIVDPEVQDIMQRAGMIGAIDQITDNVDALSDPEHYMTSRGLYR